MKLKIIFISSMLLLEFSNSARAQNSPAPFAGITPKVERTDSNGVDMLNAKASITVPLVSFGKSGTEMALNFSLSMPYRKDWDWTTVTSYASVSDLFAYFFEENLDLNPVIDASFDMGSPIRTTALPYGGGFYDGHTRPDTNSDGSTIRASLGDNYLTAMTFPDSAKNGVYNAAGVKGEFSPSGLANAFQLPSGERWVLNRVAGQGITSIVSSKGYAIKFNYVGGKISSIKGYNKSKYYCDELSFAACNSISGIQNDVEISYNNTEGSVTFTYPKAGMAKKITFLKNSKGQVTIRIASVEMIGVSETKVIYNYSPVIFTNDAGTWQEAFIGGVTTNVGSWSYTYDRNNYGSLSDISHVSRISPDGRKISAEGSFLLGQGIFVDELNRSTNVCAGGSSNNYNSPCTILPNGNSYYYGRDARGNITTLIINPAPGSADSPTYRHATYPQECLNPLSCNKPLTVTDGKGGQTIYTYDPNNGNILTKISPPDLNGISPAEKYYYTQRYAMVLNSSGSFVQSPTPIWVLSEMRSCAKSSLDVVNGVCAAGSSDLIKKTYDYDASSGMGSNLLLKGVAIETSGSIIRTCYSYDDSGNMISETKPNANLATCS